VSPDHDTRGGLPPLPSMKALEIRGFIAQVAPSKI
jgi:hypothetical protein